MQGLIAFIGILQIIAGVIFFALAKSAIHEILGSLTFGLGILSVALAAALTRLDEIKTSSQQSASLQSRIAEAFDRLGY